MRCDLLLGLMLGALAGMALVEFCKPVKDVVEQGKEKIKQTVQKM